MMKLLTIRCLALGLLLTPILEILQDSITEHFTLLLITGVMITLDTISGVYAAYRHKEANSGSFWNKFFDKFVAYTILLVLAFVVFILSQTTKEYQIEMDFAEHIITYPISVILIREFWSIGENINKIQPKFFDNFKNLFSKIIKK